MQIEFFATNSTPMLISKNPQKSNGWILKGLYAPQKDPHLN